MQGEGEEGRKHYIPENFWSALQNWMLTGSGEGPGQLRERATILAMQMGRELIIQELNNRLTFFFPPASGQPVLPSSFSFRNQRQRGGVISTSSLGGDM